jgi:nucleoid DNA-binding protein
MYPLVHKYLVLHHKVSIPGIGNFSIVREPAAIQGQQLLAPIEHVYFKAETALADKSFYSFLAHEMQIDDVDAIKRFHEFAYELKSKISYADSLRFPGIGLLKKQHNGSFSFEEEQEKLPLFETLSVAPPPPQPEKIIATEIPTITPDFSNLELEPVDAVEPKKDYWWLYAALLAMAGIAAIIYYYNS